MKQKENIPPGGTAVTVSIPRPRGQAGRTKNGFHLQTAMGLIDDKPQYLAIRVRALLILYEYTHCHIYQDNVRGYTKAHLEAGLPLTQQNNGQVWKVIQLVSVLCSDHRVDLLTSRQVKHNHPFVARFKNDWPVRCILSDYLGHSNSPKGSLKHKKALAKQAKARGKTIAELLGPADNSDAEGVQSLEGKVSTLWGGMS